MKKWIALFVAAVTTVGAQADTPLLETMTARWNTFIFVSTQMPRETLLELAREAGAAHAVIVLNGFGGTDATLMSTQKFAKEINDACCQKQPARWVIDPVLTKRYHVVSVPTFVVGHGNTDNPGEYSKVAGEISLSQALKFFAQDSKLESASDFAKRTYYSAFGDKY
jgi:conjugal transfer pilus assembly protein TrbC